jgi:hypothetical protein
MLNHHTKKAYGGVELKLELLTHRVQTGSGAHPASYPMGTSGFFPGGKVAGK